MSPSPFVLEVILSFSVSFFGEVFSFCEGLFPVFLGAGFASLASVFFGASCFSGFPGFSVFSVCSSPLSAYF
jgi:hypothetical protein